jgi:thymidylate synthase
MDITKKVENLNKLEKKLNSFKEILENLEFVDDQMKALWVEIYKNSTYDREEANKLYQNLYVEIQNNPTNHAVYGIQVTKYLERMCKSNDQLIKLAEMIIKREEKATEIDANSIFDSIGG